VYRPPTSSGPKEQIERIQTLIDSKVDVIVVRPLDATSIVPAVLAARDACIPVFTINRVLDSKLAVAGEDYVTSVSADAVSQGQMVADWLAKATEGKAKIIEIEGTPGASSADGRKKGFEQEIARAPDMKVVASKTARYDRTQGHDVAKELLLQCPQCNAIYAHNDNMALGALAAVRELGKIPARDVVIVGVDGVKEAIDGIIAGTVGATVFNEPRMGAITFTLIEKYGSGRPVEPKVVVKGPLIDHTNARAMIAEAF
jgi:ribose transport system substrate-binding protein